MPTQARERLLDTAEDLFYSDGIRAVGLERILSTSGVGRASFYRHFASKDDLVVAVLQRRDKTWREWLATKVDTLGGHPLNAFDAIAERFTAADFRGCAFINTMIESADPASEAHGVAASHKEALTSYLAGLLRTNGLPESLAAPLVLLMDGATVTALRVRTAEPALQAKELAAALIARAPV